MPAGECAIFFSCLSNHEHMVRFATHPEAQYKIVRALDPVFDSLEVLAKAANASDQIVIGLEYARLSAKISRDILSTLYAYIGGIPILLYGSKIFYDLARTRNDDQQIVVLKPFKNDLGAYSDFAIGCLEKRICLTILILKCINVACQLYAAFLSRFGERGQFQRVLLFKHICSFVSALFECWFHTIAHKRTGLDESELQRNYSIFLKKQGEIYLNIVEKGLQIGYDGAKLAGYTPPWLRLPLSLAIASLGIYRVWIKTD